MLEKRGRTKTYSQSNDSYIGQTIAGMIPKTNTNRYREIILTLLTYLMFNDQMGV